MYYSSANGSFRRRGEASLAPTVHYALTFTQIPFLLLSRIASHNANSLCPSSKVAYSGWLERLPFVFFDGCAAQGNAIIKLSRSQNIISSDPIFAFDPSRFTHTNVDAQSTEFGVFVTGHFVAQESHVLERLFASFHLGL
jgi:hypothetical protein